MLESERIILKKINLEDADFYLEMENRSDVMQFINRPTANSKQEAIEHINKLIDFNDKNPDIGNFVAFSKSDNKRIGTIVYRFLDKTTELEIGYRIHPDYWRQGFVTEACKIILAEAKKNFPHQKVTAVTNPANLPSQKVLLKLGFNYCGIQNYYDSDLSYFEYYHNQNS